jgi:signal transduction histidine kinase
MGALLARHPLAVDALVAGLLFALMTRVTPGDLSVVWLATLHLPLVVRRRWPVAAFWTVTVVAFASIGVGFGGPALLLVPALAGYTVARHRSRRFLWPMVVPAAAFIVGWWWHGGPLWDALTLVVGFGLALLSGVYRQTRQEHLAERDQLAVAAERARIAREMHDIVAHNLAVMVALADGAAAVTARAPERGVEMMRQTAMTGRQALKEVRRLVGLLRFSEEDVRLSPPPGLADLDELVAQVRTAGLAVTLTRTGCCGELGPGPELAIYRIVQEALTNTIKHAGPGATALVELRCAPAEAEVTITDDGPVSGPVGTGHGLAGMTERAAPYGGTVTAGPGPDRGWRVHAHLALDGSQAR